MNNKRRFYGIIAAALAVAAAIVAGVVISLTSGSSTPAQPMANPNTSTSVPVTAESNQPETVGTPSLASVPSSATSAPKATTTQVTATQTHRNTPHVTPSATPTPSMTRNPDPYKPYHGTYYSESQRATMVFGLSGVSCNGHSLRTYQAKLSYKGGGTVCMDFVVAKVGLKGHITYPVVSGGGQNVRLTHQGSCLSLSGNADGVPDLCRIQH